MFCNPWIVNAADLFCPPNAPSCPSLQGAAELSAHQGASTPSKHQLSALAGTKDRDPDNGPMHHSAIFRKVAGEPPMDISELKEGSCATTAIFMFFRNFYVNHGSYRENPPARMLGASFLQWMFQNTPGMLERAPLPKRLTVVKRTGWRRIVNGDEFVQKARALRWQAEVILGGSVGRSCEGNSGHRPATDV